MQTPPKSIHHRRRTDSAADYSCSNPYTTIVPEMGLAAMELAEILGYYTQANHKFETCIAQTAHKREKEALQAQVVQLQDILGKFQQTFQWRKSSKNGQKSFHKRYLIQPTD
jgi:hypothetical protein